MVKEKFSSPLGLRKPLTKFPLSFDWVVWIDCVAIVMLMMLLNSEYLFLPGLGIELPTQSNEGANFESPSATMTLLNANTIIFQHQPTNWEELPRLLEKYSTNNPASNQILMIRVSRSVSVNLLLQATSIAKNAGFKKVFLPTETD